MSEKNGRKTSKSEQGIEMLLMLSVQLHNTQTNR